MTWVSQLLTFVGVLALGAAADAQEAANWYFKAGRQGHGLASEGARDLLADTGSFTEAEAIKKDLRLGARQKAYSDFLSGELDANTLGAAALQAHQAVTHGRSHRCHNRQ